jgi:hypothetical protein
MNRRVFLHEEFSITAWRPKLQPKNKRHAAEPWEISLECHAIQGWPFPGDSRGDKGNNSGLGENLGGAPGNFELTQAN